MRRKNVFEFCILGLFIMCMALALSASLEYVTVGSEREYLGQAKWLLSLLCLTLVGFFSVRVAHKIGCFDCRKTKIVLTAGACAAFFLAGLWLRMWVIENISVEPDSDFETYYRMALELYNDTFLTPAAALDRRYAAMYPHTIGFPMLLLQPAFHLFGPSVKTALYANLVCSMISVLLAGHIGKRIAGKVGAVVAVAFMSLWPSHILFSNMVATEQSFTMMILLAADIILHVMERGKGSIYDVSPLRGIVLLLFLGVVLALAGAIRPMALILLAAYAVVQLFIGGDPTGEIPQSGSRWALARGWMCVLLVLVPYILTGNIINKAISDTILTEPAKGLTASGYNLMVGVNTASGGRWNDEDSRFFGDFFDETGDANAAHEACMQKAIERITKSPEDVLNLLVYKFRDLWQTDDFGVDWNLQWTDMQGTQTPEIKQLLEQVRPVGRVMYMAVLLFALVSALDAWRRSTAPQSMLMVSILFFLGTALAHMLLETQVRYHYNMIPFLILLGVYAVAGWRQRMAEEPAVKLVKVANLGMDEAMTDHTHFDMHNALKEGHVIMSVSEAVAADAERRSFVEANAEETEEKIEEQPVAEVVEPEVEEAAEEVVTEETEEQIEEVPVSEDVVVEAEVVVEEAVTEEPEEQIEEVPVFEEAVPEVVEAAEEVVTEEPEEQIEEAPVFEEAVPEVEEVAEEVVTEEPEEPIEEVPVSEDVVVEAEVVVEEAVTEEPEEQIEEVPVFEEAVPEVVEAAEEVVTEEPEEQIEEATVFEDIVPEVEAVAEEVVTEESEEHLEEAPVSEDVMPDVVEVAEEPEEQTITVSEQTESVVEVVKEEIMSEPVLNKVRKVSAEEALQIARANKQAKALAAEAEAAQRQKVIEMLRRRKEEARRKQML